MQATIVTEISRTTYLELQKAWHANQVRLVREAVLRVPETRK